MAVMEEEAKELLSYFNHRNVDALLRLTRNTLEMLRRRINTPSAMHFAGENETITNVSFISFMSRYTPNNTQMSHKI